MSAAEPSLLFTLVVPVYGVASYLPEFLAGLDDQEDVSDVEVIFVDDGSPDDSVAIIERWLSERTAWTAQLIRQPNGGLCRARNTGLERARGVWVSFPDPDDRMEPDYLAAVRAMLVASPEVDLVCANALIWDDAAHTVTQTHPLHHRFRRGDRVVNLQHHPETIHLQAATAFYRRLRVEGAGLNFDPAIRPSFEDAAFTVRYLALHQPPQVALVATARYRYRRRAAGSSLVQRSWAQPAKYADVLEHGYLPLLRDLRTTLGVVPLWAQHTVLYDLLFTFRREDRAPGLRDLVDPAWTPRFHELVEQVLRHVDPETVDAFSVMRTSRQLRTALMAGYQGRNARPGQASITRYDAEQQLIEVRYFFTGQEPIETWHIAGTEVSPCHAKTRDLPYLGRVLLRERLCWLPATGDLRLWLDGRATALTYGPEPEPRYLAEASGWRRELGPAKRETKASPSVPTSRPSLAVDLRSGARSALRRVEALVGTRRRPASAAPTAPDFVGAWVFAREAEVDRSAPDDVEQLWHWIRRTHPEINAWQLVAGEPSADGDRQVVVGTDDHRRLLSRARHLVAGDPDRRRWLPPGEKASAPVSWRFTVLPGESLDGEAARWLSRMPLDRLAVATSAELVALTGPGSPSPLTSREVRLTGLPRHDRLVRQPPSAESSVVLLDRVTGAATAAALRERLGPALHVLTEDDVLHVLTEDDDPYAWLPRAAVLVTVHPWLALDANLVGRPAVGWSPAMTTRWSAALGPQVDELDALVELIEHPPTVPDLGFGARDVDSCRRVYESLLILDAVDPCGPPRLINPAGG